MDISRRHFSHSFLSALSLSAAGILSGCITARPLRAPVLSGNTVLALGDSLTYGTGATLETSYPAVLAKITGWNIINAGIVGNSSSEALERLPSLLKEHQPKLILTCIGVNDFTKGLPEETTFSHLQAICKLVDSAWAQHMLIAAPYLTRPALTSIPLYDSPVYRHVARRMNVPLLEKALTLILSNPALRADELHANAQGYARLAKAVAYALFKEDILLYNDRWYRYAAV